MTHWGAYCVLRLVEVAASGIGADWPEVFLVKLFGKMVGTQARVPISRNEGCQMIASFNCD